jgi:hypothetical protein
MSDSTDDEVEQAVDRVRDMLSEAEKRLPDEHSAKIEKGYDMADQLEGTLKEVRRN